MTAVDRLACHLRLKSGDGIHDRRVAFLQEVKAVTPAQIALVDMVRQARDPPDVNYYRGVQALSAAKVVSPTTCTIQFTTQARIYSTFAYS
jgi:hypothetical protein